MDLAFEISKLGTLLRPAISNMPSTSLSQANGNSTTN
ncbi:hypothetical protein FOPG_19700 [Fusarium oxysporum f. sp. conglutinans race 2 54008]|uniref:Uncharacterized protein n=1 Tax=Fusarium oxysporum f. sp. conglutinans race 2 54008 TaxID=1089457 RepID=X0GVT3_FUSOX|nr:hypothetical protein FOPG_19700 [Fusarium oxysporum f. sp. conglutinans race 2 54008]